VFSINGKNLGDPYMIVLGGGIKSRTGFSTKGPVKSILFRERIDEGSTVTSLVGIDRVNFGNAEDNSVPIWRKKHRSTKTFGKDFERLQDLGTFECYSSSQASPALKDYFLRAQEESNRNLAGETSLPGFPDATEMPDWTELKGADGSSVPEESSGNLAGESSLPGDPDAIEMRSFS
jgi:hypothetical protein